MCYGVTERPVCADMGLQIQYTLCTNVQSVLLLLLLWQLVSSLIFVTQIFFTRVKKVTVKVTPLPVLEMPQLLVQMVSLMIEYLYLFVWFVFQAVNGVGFFISVMHFNVGKQSILTDQRI